MIPVLPLIGLASAALWAVLTVSALQFGFPATFMGIALLALAMFALSRRGNR